MKFLAGTAALALAAAPAVARAQQGGDAAADVSADVVVTGRGLDGSPSDRVVDVVTIDRDRITTNARNRLEGVLADVAGLQQFRRSDARSANPTSQGITLRGLGGNASSRALLILDGVPQADPFGGWVAFPAYATGRLGRIRVTRGGGSGYHGPGALAGTVELDSVTPERRDGLSGSVAYGSRASVDAQAAAALVRDDGFAALSGAYARGDGFVPTVPESRGSIDRAAPYEQASGAIRAAVRVAPDTELQANLAAFADRRERGTPFTANLSQGADASVRMVGRGRWGWSALAYLQTRSFASSFASIDAARTAATQTLDQYNTPATGMGGRLEIAPPLGDRVALRFGADARVTSGRTQERFSYVAAQPTRLRAAGGESRTVGVFADGSLELGPLTLALGGRLDHWRIERGFLNERQIATGAAISDQHFPDRSGNEATGRFGVAWRVAEALSLRAAAYRGWRLPTLNELYRPFRVGADATAANAALDPERLTGYEVGATVTPTPDVRLAATWFDNRLNDAIGNVTVARGPGVFPGVGFVAAGGAYRVRRNIDAVRSRGIEIDAEARHGPGFARASWSHVAARVAASGSAIALDGLVPAQTPRDQVAGTIGWRQGNAVISGTMRHVSRQFDDDQNSRSLTAATTFDAYAALPLTSRLTIEARAENIADARVEAGISGVEVIERATPRTLWIGLRYGGG